MFSFFIFLHFIIIALVAQLIFRIDAFDFLLKYKGYLIAILNIDLATNYFLFFRKTNPTKILSEFDNIIFQEEKSLKRNTTIYVLSVIAILIVSIVLFTLLK
jgi:hypothetical protein